MMMGNANTSAMIPLSSAKKHTINLSTVKNQVDYTNVSVGGDSHSSSGFMSQKHSHVKSIVGGKAVGAQFQQAAHTMQRNRFSVKQSGNHHEKKIQ